MSSESSYLASETKSDEIESHLCNFSSGFANT